MVIWHLTGLMGEDSDEYFKVDKVNKVILWLLAARIAANQDTQKGVLQGDR